MIFQRKTFVDTVKSLSPDGKLYFRDSAGKGAFEVMCLRKTKSPMEKILMKAVFQSEDFSKLFDNDGSIGEPFIADAKDVLSALAGKSDFAEYKDGLFDGVSVIRCVPQKSSDADNLNGIHNLIKLIEWHDSTYSPELSLSIPEGQHRIIARNIKKFPSDDLTRSFMCGVCFHFKAEDDIRIAATDGRCLAVYEIQGSSSIASPSSWTVSSDMLFVPPFKYASAVYNFSKDAVSMEVRGDRYGEAVISSYDVAMEWRKLRDLRMELKSLGPSDNKKKGIEKSIAECLENGPERIFPDYERHLPYGNTEKLVLSMEEISLALDKLKRSLYKNREGANLFVIDALDKENIFLTSLRGINENAINYIDTKLPLKRAEISQASRFLLNRDLFGKCCLEGKDRLEFTMKNMNAAFQSEGVDTYKGHSVKVKKVFMPCLIDNSLDKKAA
jgi:hypothetical protein